MQPCLLYLHAISLVAHLRPAALARQRPVQPGLLGEPDRRRQRFVRGFRQHLRWRAHNPR